MALAHVPLRYPLRWQTPPGEVYPPDTLRHAQHALDALVVAGVVVQWDSREDTVTCLASRVRPVLAALVPLLGEPLR